MKLDRWMKLLINAVIGMGALGAGFLMVLFQAFKTPAFLMATLFLTAESLLLNEKLKEFLKNEG